MKNDFIENNNSFFTILKNYKKIKFYANVFYYEEFSNIFQLLFKNLFKKEKNSRIKQCFTPTARLLCDVKIYHKIRKKDLKKITLYEILKQIPKDIISKVATVKIIIPADDYTRIANSDIYTKGYDISIIRIYTE